MHKPVYCGFKLGMLSHIQSRGIFLKCRELAQVVKRIHTLPLTSGGDDVRTRLYDKLTKCRATEKKQLSSNSTATICCGFQPVEFVRYGLYTAYTGYLWRSHAECLHAPSHYETKSPDTTTTDTLSVRVTPLLCESALDEFGEDERDFVPGVGRHSEWRHCPGVSRLNGVDGLLQRRYFLVTHCQTLTKVVQCLTHCVHTHNNPIVDCMFWDMWHNIPILPSFFPNCSKKYLCPLELRSYLTDVHQVFALCRCVIAAINARIY